MTSDLMTVLPLIPLFSCLKTEELSAIAEISSVACFEKDQFLIREGDTDASLFIMLQGSAQAITVGSKGRQIVLDVFTAGDYFGEMSFIDGEPRSASVVALDPCRVLVLPRDGFRELIQSHPDLMFNLMKILSGRVRNVTRLLEDLMFIVSREELNDAHLETIDRLVLAAEYKDDNTGNHIARVSSYSRLMASKCELPDQEVEYIQYAAPMHDVGKIGISEKILKKKGRLTHEEFEVMKTHTTIGAKILSNPKSDLLKLAYQIALCHHEKFDGTGYPRGLKGGQIPLAARIVGIMDTFDALVSSRPYKMPYPPDVALEMLLKERGKHFDPQLVDIFVEYFEEVLEIRKKLMAEDELSLSSFTWSSRDCQMAALTA